MRSTLFPHSVHHELAAGASIWNRPIWNGGKICQIAQYCVTEPGTTSMPPAVMNPACSSSPGRSLAQYKPCLACACSSSIACANWRGSEMTPDTKKDMYHVMSLEKCGHHSFRVLWLKFRFLAVHLVLREMVNPAMSSRCQRWVTAFHCSLLYNTLFRLWRRRWWIVNNGL